MISVRARRVVIVVSPGSNCLSGYPNRRRSASAGQAARSRWEEQPHLSDGQVVGVVTSSLDEYVAYKMSGKLPQNVNYAVKSDYVIPLLIGYFGKNWNDQNIPARRKTATSLVKDAEPSVVLVIAR